MEPPGHLREAFESGALIVCAGPRVDVAAGLPSVEQLAAALLDRARTHAIAELDEPAVVRALAEGRHALAFAQLQYALGRPSFTRGVTDQLGSSFTVAPVLAALARLHAQLRAVYTTSLVDALYNRAFAGRWPSYDEPRPGLAQRRGLIFHLRGTLGRPAGWILTEDEEHQRLRSGAPRADLFATIYQAHRLLLVGFELDSPELRSVLAMLPPLADGLTPEHFMIVEGECSADDRRRLGQRGFELLVGDPEQLLRALASEPEHERAGGSAATGACPYPGLEAFDEPRAAAFFGRHVEVSQATARLGRRDDGSVRRWLSVEGPSGVGKSSFVLAGVVPALRRGYAATPSRWLVATMRPGARPLRTLVAAVHDALELPLEPAALASIVARTHARPNTLAELIGARTPAGAGFLLVVDQLEESVTFASERERAPFAAAIAAALLTPSFYLITTARTDFVPSLQSRLPGLAALINEHTERFALPPISRVGLREAIVEPAARERVTIDAAALEQMLADADTSAGPDADLDGDELRSSETALPLVAHVLRALWDAGAGDDRTITLADYRAVGGVRGALRRSAEAALAGLDEAELRAAEALLLGLVRVQADGHDTRRTLTRDEAVALAGGSPRGERLLLRLSGHADADAATRTRLLIVSHEGEQGRVDLVHEALLRDWPRYRGLIERNRRQLLIDHELERRALWWDENGRPRDEQDLPAGQELAALLGGRPHGPKAKLQRRYQRALRGAERRRRLRARKRLIALIVALALVAVASTSLSFVFLREVRRVDAGNLSLAADLRALEGEHAALLADVPGRELEAVRLGLAALGEPPDYRPAAVAGIVAAVQRLDGRLPLDGHVGAVAAVEFAPTGERLASAGVDDRSVRIRDARTGATRLHLRHPDRVRDLAFSPDASLLASACDDGLIRVFDAGTGALVRVLHGPRAPVTELAFSPEGRRLAAIGEDQRARIWSLDDGGALVILAEPPGALRGVAFMADGEAVVTASEAGELRIHSAHTGTLVQVLAADAGPIRALASAAIGDRLATLGDARVQVWSVDAGVELARLELDVPARALALARDGRQLALALADARVVVLDVDDGDTLAQLDAPAELHALAFAPAGDRLALAGAEPRIAVVDLDGAGEDREPRALVRDEAPILALALDRANGLIATAHADDRARIWSADGAPILTTEDPDAELLALARAPDGRIATGHADGRVRLWRGDGRPLTTIDVAAGPVRALEFSRDGELLVSAHAHGLWIWDSHTHAQRLALIGHGGSVDAVALSPDASTLVSGGADGSARVWALDRPDSPIALLVDPTAPVAIHDLAFAPSGELVASAGHDGVVRLWSVDGQLQARLTGHRGPALAVAFAPDGGVLASAGADRSARLWALPAGEPFAILLGHRDALTELAFTPAGALATASLDGSVRLWPTSRRTWLERGCDLLELAGAHDQASADTCARVRAGLPAPSPSDRVRRLTGLRR